MDQEVDPPSVEGVEVRFAQLTERLDRLTACVLWQESFDGQLAKAQACLDSLRQEEGRQRERLADLNREIAAKVESLARLGELESRVRAAIQPMQSAVGALETIRAELPDFEKRMQQLLSQKRELDAFRANPPHQSSASPSTLSRSRGL